MAGKLEIDLSGNGLGPRGIGELALPKSLLHMKIRLSLLILRKIAVVRVMMNINGSKPSHLGFETPGRATVWHRLPLFLE